MGKLFKHFKWIILTLAFLCFAQRAEAEEGGSEETFTYIYDNEMWGVNEDGSPSSGWGSWVEYARPYMEFLVEFMNANQVHSVVDVGCGDWAFSRYIHWGGINYIGIDVVKSVIERNQELFTAPNIKFVHGDILNMDLPPGDLLVCKEVLQHLTNQDISHFLTKIKKYKHCLITNDISLGKGNGVGKRNKDIPHRGPNRPLDLSKPPFNVKGVKIFTYTVEDYDHVKQVFYIQNQVD